MTFEDKTPAYVEVRLRSGGSKKVIQACADTGASLSMIDERFVRRHLKSAILHDSDVIGIKGIGGSSVITKYLMAEVVVQDVNGREVAVPARFFINPAKDSRIVIGNDFMVHYGGIMNLQHHHLTLTRGSSEMPVTVRLDIKRDAPATIRSAECFTIKPFHTARIPVRLHGKVSTKMYYLDPVPLGQGKVAASAARAIGTVARGIQVAEVYNLDPFPLLIQAGETLGNARPLLDRSGVIPDNGQVLTANLHNRNERQDRAHFAEAVKDLDLNNAAVPGFPLREKVHGRQGRSSPSVGRD